MFPTFSTIAAWFACPLDAMRTGTTNSRSRTRSVLLVRHALAARGGDGPDEQRALTKEGRDDALRLGGALRAHGLVPDAIVTSPARRAQETASGIARSAGFAGDIRIEPSLYGGGAAGIGATLRMLSPDDSRVLVVGHDPGTSECLERLTGAREGLPPGGLAQIDLDADDWSHLDEISRRSWLVQLWRPRDARSGTSNVPPQIDRHPRSKWIAGRVDEPLVDAAARAIEQKLEDVLDRLAAVSDAMAEDEEAIRRLRVAARRAEAALRVYRDVLPQRGFARVRDQMRAIRKATNAARDDDVSLARLDSHAMAEVVARLQEDRRAARHMVHALCRRLAGDGKLARRMADLLRKTRGRRGEEYAATPFGEWAGTRLARSAARFFAVASVDFADVDELHGLRRRAKKLRYEVEILAGVLPRRLRSEIYPILSELQDRLGTVNDHAVAVRSLQRLAGTQLAGNSTEALDANVVESESALTTARDDFAAWWTTERRDSLQQELSRLR